MTLGDKRTPSEPEEPVLFLYLWGDTTTSGDDAPKRKIVGPDA